MSTQEQTELEKKAEQCVENKDWDGVIEASTQLITLFEEQDDTQEMAVAYNNRGFAYAEKGDSDRAIEDYDQAIDLNPDNAFAYINRGLVYAKKGDYNRAIEDYDQAIKLNPNDADAYNNRGLVYAKKGDYNRAIEDYDQAIKLNPNDADAYNNRGLVYAKKGDYNRAIEDYDQAIKLNPNDAGAYNNRGLAYAKKGDYNRAIEDYERAIKLNHNDAGAYNNRGNAYAKKGDYNRAIEDYERAIKLEPNYVVAYNNRGLVYAKKGDYNRAIEDYERAIKLNPNDAGAYNNRGIAYAKKGEYDRAIEDYERAIKLNHNDAGAYNNRGIAYAEKGDSDQAIKDYGRAIDLNPNDAAAYYNRGIAYYAKDNYDRAFQGFLKVVEISPDYKPKYPRTYLVSKIEAVFEQRQEQWGKCFKRYMSLLDTINNIQKQLFLSNEVAHYTSLDTLKNLADNTSSFRLYNASYMNDPEEGQVIFKVMGQAAGMEKECEKLKQIFYDEDAQLSPAYIGSFVKVTGTEGSEKDQLFLWRTYGKHQGEEAAGVCLVYDQTDFSEEHKTEIGTMPQLAAQTDTPRKPSKPSLYKIHYDEQSDEKLKQELKKLAEKLKEIKEGYLGNNEAGLNEDEKTRLKQLTREFLDSIRFLFKASHYQPEDEARVVMMSYDASEDERVKEDTGKTPPCFYMEMPDSFLMSEVILGPKAGDADRWKWWLEYKKLKVTKSKIPFK